MTRIDHSPMQVVYASMRAWLMETGLQPQATDLMDPQGSGSVRGSLSDLLRVEAALASAEEDQLFPRLLELAPYLVCHFEQEHQQIAKVRFAYTSYMTFVLQHGMREKSILTGSELAVMNCFGPWGQKPADSCCARSFRAWTPCNAKGFGTARQLGDQNTGKL